MNESLMKLSARVAAVAISLAVPIVIDKISAARAEKKRLKDGNIIVLIPEIRL